MSETLPAPPRRQLPWLEILVVWSLWLIAMVTLRPAVLSFGEWAAAWPMAIAMLAGSFIAGSTSVGGGAVAFPVMTLVLGMAPLVARDFSLTIQAIGMSMAALGIIAARTPVHWPLIGRSMLGVCCGLPIGLWLLPAFISGAGLKLFFVSLWFAYGLSLFWRRSGHSQARRPHTWLAVIAGIVGGAISGLTGTGADIILFVLMLSLWGMPAAMATPTSVILMALTAVLGSCLRLLDPVPFATAAIASWWMCVPVVIVGAPLGAWYIRGRSDRFILRLLSTITIAQFIGAMLIIELNGPLLALSAGTLVLALGFFGLLTRYGHRHQDDGEEERADAEKARQGHRASAQSI